MESSISAIGNRTILDSHVSQNNQLKGQQSVGAEMLVIIDPRVEEYHMLVMGVHQGANVLVLNPNIDGIEQITKALAHHTVSSLHIVCHGAPETLYLGKTPLNLANLKQYRQQLQEWRVAEILLYACNVAAGESLSRNKATAHLAQATGKRIVSSTQLGVQSAPKELLISPFLNRLHQLTSASIAASAHQIGNAAKGGSWHLEYQIGEIAQGLAFLPEVRQAYPGIFNANFVPAPGSPIQVDNRPNSVAVGDFDGDGDPDLVAANSGSNNVSVLLGNGDGTFAAPTNLGVGTTPNAVAVADFDGDGNLDIVSANNGSSDVSVLLGNGDGTFDDATNFVAGTSPRSLAVADFDGDGSLDLVTAGAGGVSVLSGDGNGNFGPATNLGVTSSPYSVAVGDFSGDGNLDLVTANAEEFVIGTVSVLLGNGDNTFRPARDFRTGDSDPESVAVGDLNGDGILDIAVANEDNGDGTISVMLGNGDGTFNTTFDTTNNFPFPTTGQPSSVDLVDVNSDGNLDLLSAGGETISVRFGNGDGTFGDSCDLDGLIDIGVGVASSAIVVEDFDGDGLSDLAVAGFNTDAVTILLNRTPSVIISDTAVDVTEGGATTTYTVVLGSEPTGNVTIDFNTGNQVDAIASLSFDASNWNIPQTVTVEAVDDNLIEGTHTQTISHSATSTDPDYNGISIVDVEVTITDNDDKNFINGTSLSETMVGTSGDECINGLGGHDIIAGGLGSDELLGEAGNDEIIGDLNKGGTEGMDDIIYGGTGQDRIYGSGGNDDLYGEAGNDQIWGDAGDDLLWGGLGDDILTGGQGSDTFVLAAGEGTDFIGDFQNGTDMIGLANGLTFGQLSIDQFGSQTWIIDQSNNQVLALLTGVDASTLTAASFVTI
ncbi:MAG: DUF4347 domain-containing protein [Symploca sp. SIO2G7]|nr:DUF4347 domain-containing protein [Symploca sp. SIO2G7]